MKEGDRKMTKEKERENIESKKEMIILEKRETDKEREKEADR